MRLMPMAGAPPAARYYVSLGDSMSIDAYAGGPGWGAASLLFKNRDEDFPDWAGRDLSHRMPGARLIPLVMDGGTAATVRYAQIPRLKEMGVKASLVTLTMGGNDLLACFGNDAAASAARRALQTNGNALLADLRKNLLLPDARVVLGTIIDPSDGEDEWIGRFNETLRALADAHDCHVADIHARFLSHGRTHPNPWLCGTMEPNAWGASAIRAAFWDALGEDR